MRAVYVIPLCGLLVVAGFVFAFGRSPTLPNPSATTPSTSAALTLPPPAPPPGPSSSAQADTPAAPATAGLACIQDALGGVRAFAGVSTLRIVANTEPTATSRPRPAPGKREIRVVFPDRYKSYSEGIFEGRPLPPIVNGFNGNVLLSSPTMRPPDQAIPGILQIVRVGFVHEMLMRLPRELAGVRMRPRLTRDSGQERLAIDVFGMERLRATLLADPRTCVPVAAEYLSGSDKYRVELSEYRAFGGVRFPTVLKYAKDGAPWNEEHVSEIQVNAPVDDDYFRQ
jgi:hypothetical protein